MLLARLYLPTLEDAMDTKKTWENRNREKVREYHKKSYRKNFEYYREYAKRYAAANREYLNNSTRRHRKANIDSWRGYFAGKSRCQLCGRRVVYSSGISKKSIHFDHRNGGSEIIKGSPMSWFGGHPRNKVNEKILESCNFGILCFRCNKFLPTEDRTLWLENAMRYNEANDN
jgi:hypothetical protein